MCNWKQVFAKTFAKMFRNWRGKPLEIMFFEPGCRGKLFWDVDLVAAIDSIKFSSKSEPSARFFGRLKIDSASALGHSHAPGDADVMVFS